MIRATWLAIACISIASSTLAGCSSTPTYSAPATFTVTNDAVIKAVQLAIGAAPEATKLDGPARASCDDKTTCQIAYTIQEPLGGTGDMNDLEMIQPTRQIWKTLFADPAFKEGTITVSGPVTSVGGKSSTDIYYTLVCDRQAAAQIDWDKVDGNGLRTLCTYMPMLKGLPGN